MLNTHKSMFSHFLPMYQGISHVNVKVSKEEIKKCFRSVCAEKMSGSSKKGLLFNESLLIRDFCFETISQ